MTGSFYKFKQNSNAPEMDSALSSYDALVDLRSTGHEHWTYNFGIINKVVEARGKVGLRIRVTSALVDILGRLGVEAKPRLEWATNSPRLIRLLTRELLSAVEIFYAALRSKRIIVLHCHPLGLIMAWPILIFFGGRFTICLHNDFVGALHDRGWEHMVEKWLWWCMARLNHRLTFAVQNRLIRRYARSFFPAATNVVIWPHPIVPRQVYESLGSGAEDNLPLDVHMGFFGRVELNRGMTEFESYISKNPDKYFIVAGIGAKKFPKFANVNIYEQPIVNVYCALATRCNSFFVDLSRYRAGESGVFWDGVGLNVPLFLGDLPILHRERLRKCFSRQPAPLSHTESRDGINITVS